VISDVGMMMVQTGMVNKSAMNANSLYPEGRELSVMLCSESRLALKVVVKIKSFFLLMIVNYLSTLREFAVGQNI